MHHQNDDVELEKLLSESIESARRREASVLDPIARAHGNALVLFGCGALGRKALACLRQNSIEPLSFADNNPARWGQSVESLPVISPQEAAQRYGRAAAFVVTIWSPGHSFVATRQQLENLGCSTIMPMLPLLWKYPQALLPHYTFDLPHRLLEQSNDIRKAFHVFDDDESRRQFLAHLRLRLLADFGGLPVPEPEEQYFASGIISLSSNEVFVDAGAYDGNTIKGLLARQGRAFNRILAFEPDPANLNKLQDYVSTLERNVQERIVVLGAAVGAHRGLVRFDASGATGAAISSTGAVEVECVALDEALDETPTFLKFDIEGAELDALAGARGLIRRARPVVAVCVYHRPEDLWRIPLYLGALVGDYRFFLRTHGYDGLDLVLYAVPPFRLVSRNHSTGVYPRGQTV